MLLRVLEPEWYDEDGPLAVGFEDPGKPYENLSFFMASMATPSYAMSELAKYKRARTLCGKKRPTPEEMYAHGYRVSKTPSGLIIAMIEATASLGPDKRVSIGGLPDTDDEIRSDGHVNVKNGRLYGQTLAADSILLSPTETFSQRRGSL